MSRIGLFGGTFDPIHWGHLLLADAAREALELDRVVFIPAAQPPHKSRADVSEARHRLEMVRLAVADDPAFEVSDVELRRDGPSYSADTVAHYAEQLAEGDRLFFLVGADTVAELPTWRDPKRLARMATLVAVVRPGSQLTDLSCLANTFDEDTIESLRRHIVEMPLVDLASRDIRRRASRGQSIRYMVPPAVQAYLETHDVYGGGRPGT